jgi:hypothetical protein
VSLVCFGLFALSAFFAVVFASQGRDAHSHIRTHTYTHTFLLYAFLLIAELHL